MIYIVGAYMRTMSSLMMQALIAGGMEAAWSEDRNNIAAMHADEHYHPNRGGLYEVSLREYQQPDFPLAYQGKLIKVMAWGLDGLAVNPGGYRIVLMHRDPEEIRQSYEAFFDKPLKHWWFTGYGERMWRAEKMLSNRRDVIDVAWCESADLVEHPELELRRLGWPIDVVKAAAVVDPSQYRFRRERLTVGI